LSAEPPARDYAVWALSIEGTECQATIAEEAGWRGLACTDS
jgi:hypothetical protein